MFDDPEGIPSRRPFFRSHNRELLTLCDATLNVMARDRDGDGRPKEDRMRGFRRLSRGDAVARESGDEANG